MLDEEGKWVRRPWWRDYMGMWVGLYMGTLSGAVILNLGIELYDWPYWPMWIAVGLLYLQTAWIFWKRRHYGSASRT